MPLIKSSDNKAVGKNIKEFRTGKIYQKTKKKFGAAKANKQAIAVALANQRKVRRMK